MLLPTVAAVTAATGAVTVSGGEADGGGGVFRPLVNLIGGLLVPVLYGYIAATIAYSAVGNNGSSR